MIFPLLGILMPKGNIDLDKSVFDVYPNVFFDN
jgi:hypothetical protein